MGFNSKEEFDTAVEGAVEVLKETYINNIVYVQERMKDNAEESELKQIEEIILATERMIVFFMQTDEWVKKLHDEANANTEEGELVEDDDTEADRIEEARNS